MSPVPSLPVTTKGVVLNLCLMMFIGISIQINTTTSSDNIISSYHQMLLLLVTHMSPLTFFGCVLSTAVPVVVLLVAAAYRGDSCSLTSARGPWNGVAPHELSLLLSTIYRKKVIGAHLEQVGTRLGLINTREHPLRACHIWGRHIFRQQQQSGTSFTLSMVKFQTTGQLIPSRMMMGLNGYYL